MCDVFTDFMSQLGGVMPFAGLLLFVVVTVALICYLPPPFLFPTSLELLDMSSKN
jgi:hypothetical protein